MLHVHRIHCVDTVSQNTFRHKKYNKSQHKCGTCSRKQHTDFWLIFMHYYTIALSIPNPLLLLSIVVNQGYRGGWAYALVFAMKIGYRRSNTIHNYTHITILLLGKSECMYETGQHSSILLKITYEHEYISYIIFSSCSGVPLHCIVITWVGVIYLICI